jgi:hypothetical protein
MDATGFERKQRRSLFVSECDVSSPSSLGMEPVSWLKTAQIEWKQGNVSKRDIHANKTHQSTYQDPVQSTM